MSFWSKLYQKKNNPQGNAYEDVVKTIWAESRGEGEAGLKWVASVIHNRANSKGTSVDEVVRQSGQFDGYKVLLGKSLSQIEKTIEKGSEDYKTFLKAKEIASELISGKFQPTDQAAVHFYNPDKVSQTPAWAVKDNFITKVGNHEFFSNPAEYPAKQKGASKFTVAGSEPEKRIVGNDSFGSVKGSSDIQEFEARPAKKMKFEVGEGLEGGSLEQAQRKVSQYKQEAEVPVGEKEKLTPWEQIKNVASFLTGLHQTPAQVYDIVLNEATDIGLDEEAAEALAREYGAAVSKTDYPGFAEIDMKKYGLSLQQQTKIIAKLNQELALAASAVSSGLMNVGKRGAETVVKKVLKKFNPIEYVDELVAKQAAARKGETLGFWGNIKNFFKESKNKLVDANAPVEDTLRASQKKDKFSLLPSDDITNYIDRTYRAPSLAGQFVQDNGLEWVIRNVDDISRLEQYMIAKQASAVEARGIQTGRDLAKDAKLIEFFKPAYEPYARQVNAYSRKLLDYTVDAGLISPKLANTLKARYPQYVPLNRIFSEIERQEARFGSKAVASLSKQSVVQKIKGSEREIESPLSSLLAKTYNAFVQGEKNKAAKVLAGYEKLKGNPFKLRELKKGESATHTISFLDAGKKRVFETTKEIAESARQLGVQQLNILGKMFALPVRLAKVGITGVNLPFVASNIAKDQVTAAIFSKRALKTSIANPLVFIKSLFSAVGHGKLYKEIIREAGMSTSFDIARNQPVKTIAKIRSKRGVISRIKYSITHPGDLLRSVEDIMSRGEELTRIQQYAGTKQVLLKKGMNERDAKMEAARAARENTVNFLRRGEWGKVLNSAFLYLTAGIQGTRTLLLNLAQRPVSTSVKIGLTVFTPVTIATFWNLSDEKRRQAYEDIAEWEKKNNIIIVPPNPTKDEKGRWNIIKIPLAQGVNNVATIPRIMVEQAYQVNELDAAKVADALIGTVSPIEPNINSLASSLTPQALKPTLEQISNYNFFTARPIVPYSMQSLSPELQAKPWTSGSARLAGKALGISPLKVESWIRESFGGVGSQALHIIDKALAGAHIIPKDQIGGEPVLEAITARFAKAWGGNLENKDAEAIRKLLEGQADDRFKMKQEAEVLNTAFKELPPEEANAKAKELKKSNPALYEKLKDVIEDERLGLTYSERLIKQLGVSNGERAKFIWQALQSFPTESEKNAYVDELKKKKIISEKVFKQLKALKKKNAK